MNNKLLIALVIILLIGVIECTIYIYIVNALYLLIAKNKKKA